MSLNNKISAEITAEQMAKVTAQLQEARTTLKDVLIFNLSADERQTMLKMGDRTLAFVGRAITHAKQSPNLVPSFLDVTETQKDYKLAADLYEIYLEASKFLRAVDDCMMVAGGEAYESALVFYNAVKGANKSNIAGTQDIYDDLKQQFPRNKKNTETNI
ncbi:hypothetical protein ASE74_11615 [Pedobacter sp. Leaf216]|uniref:hypothetical protein n=1 Tax=Pedobacter sp. Leaf216 TaxID=1735684 RepID=UPI0006F361A2|nr:hypothetical protein [Pedobacter sp. Leaf216]KQM64655.1 hypothetical protein ASE74_11615 [Pedobacter sp. Leaf216]